MKITIIGGGNMGGAIALGLADGKIIKPSDITVVNRNEKKTNQLKEKNYYINAVTGDYSSLRTADIIILAVKPWMIEDILKVHESDVTQGQIIISVAARISLKQLTEWTTPKTPIYKIIPNTAIAVKQSMTFIASSNTTSDQDKKIANIFDELGKTMFIEEKLFPAVTSLSSCGIAFALRYISAAMEGGIEIGIGVDQGKDIINQTIRGAIKLLENNDSHPEAEIHKVTTPGGVTIKGLNEMEHAGFTSAVIKGLKASFLE